MRDCGDGRVSRASTLGPKEGEASSKASDAQTLQGRATSGISGDALLPDGEPCCSFLPYASAVSVSPLDKDGYCWVRLAEVVEVKSCCPYFLSSDWPNNKAGEWGRHAASGVRRSVPPRYIAQVSILGAVIERCRSSSPILPGLLFSLHANDIPNMICLSSPSPLQLQLEMLAAGTQTGLLVQYSAQDGAAVYRVFRDEQVCSCDCS
jgi:hypothetical protein